MIHRPNARSLKVVSTKYPAKSQNNLMNNKTLEVDNYDWNIWNNHDEKD